MKKIFIMLIGLLLIGCSFQRCYEMGEYKICVTDTVTLEKEFKNFSKMGYSILYTRSTGGVNPGVLTSFSIKDRQILYCVEDIHVMLLQQWLLENDECPYWPLNCEVFHRIGDPD